MKVIGITGGVGSGKSTICNILKNNFNAYIIGTDDVAKDLMKKESVSYNLIVKHFGKSILDSSENIDNHKLAAIVYSDKDKLLKLNSFTHKYVVLKVKELINLNKDNYDYICVETALPIEAQLSEYCDDIWYIYASNEVRIERLKLSRNYTEEKIMKIFDKQLKEADFMKLCTNVIDTNYTEAEIIIEIKEMLSD